MPLQKSDAWLAGKSKASFYADALKDAAERPIRDAARKKIITPEEMPWEMSRHGLIEHLVNDKMNARVETVDIYMQIIPPASHSGKHRQFAEEALYVLEGLCAAAGFVPNVAFAGDESSVIRGFVKAGFGIALVPQSRSKNSS